MRRLLLLILPMIVTACAGVPSAGDRNKLLRQESFSQDYQLAVSGIWIQPPYIEVTKLLQTEHMQALEQAVVNLAHEQLPANAFAWERTPHKPAFYRSDIYRYMQQEKSQMQEKGVDSILVVAVEPGVMPRSTEFALKGPKECAPTGYSVYSYQPKYRSCPYEVRSGSTVDGPKQPEIRDVKVLFFEAFIELWTLGEDRRLISDSRIHVDCNDNGGYEPVDKKTEIVGQCFKAMTDSIRSKLEFHFTQRNRAAN